MVMKLTIDLSISKLIIWIIKNYSINVQQEMNQIIETILMSSNSGELQADKSYVG